MKERKKEDDNFVCGSVKMTIYTILFIHPLDSGSSQLAVHGESSLFSLVVSNSAPTFGTVVLKSAKRKGDDKRGKRILS